MTGLRKGFLLLKKLTIRTKILLLSLPLVLAALMVSGFMYYRVSSRSVIGRMQLDSYSLINQLARRIEERFDRTEADLKAISQLPSLPNYYFNREYGLDKEAETFRLELESFMLNVSRRAGDYETVRYLDWTGVEIVRVIGGEVEQPGTGKASQGYFKDTAGRKDDDEPYRSAIEISEDTAGRVVRFAAPVYDDLGECRGIVVIDYSFESLAELVTSSQVHTGGWTSLVSPAGIILSHPDNNLVGTRLPYLEKESVLESSRQISPELAMAKLDLFDTRYFVFFNRTPMLSWRIIQGMPVDIIYRPIHDVLKQVIIVVLVAALLSFVIASFASRRIYQVIQDLVFGARKVAEGDLKYQIVTSTDPDTAVVVDTFNEMVRNLDRQQQQLKRQLHEITDLQRYTDNLLRSILNAVVAIDHAGTITSYNPAAERIFALPAAEVMGRHWSYLLPYITDGLDIFKAIFSGFLVSTDQRLQIMNAENQAIPATINSSILIDEHDNPRGLVTVWRDLSMVINLEKQLTHSSKLASLGEISARVAHEINNPLAVISGHAQLLNMEITDMPKSEKHQKALGEIVKQCERIAKIITQIRKYSKPSKGTMRTLDLNHVAAEAIEISRFSFKKRAEIITRFEDPIPLVYGDPDLLIQVFTNVITNAAQALDDDGGTITVSTHWKESVKEQTGGENIQVRISDTGHGIDKEHLDLLFDPFYSTKTEGTGLGLAIGQTIVENHGGDIVVESAPGAGTTVIINLPIEKRKAKPSDKPAVGTEYELLASDTTEETGKED